MRERAARQRNSLMVGGEGMGKNTNTPQRPAASSTPVDKLKWLEAISADRQISHTAVRLAVALGTRFINNRTGVSFVSVDTLAKMIGVCLRAAKTAKADLERGGYVATTRRGRCRSNLSWLTMPRPSAGAALEVHEAALLEVHADALPYYPIDYYPLPPTPAAGGRGDARASEGAARRQKWHSKNEAAAPDDAGEAWRSFESVWRFNDADRREYAKAAFGRLTPAERREALRYAPAYLAACRERGLVHHLKAGAWLKGRGWEAFAGNGGALPAGGQADVTASRAAVQREDGSWRLRHDSPQLAAWKRSERLKRGAARPGLIRASEWPPLHDATPAEGAP